MKVAALPLALVPNLEALPDESPLLKETEVPFPAEFVVEAAVCRVPPYETVRDVHVKERWRGRCLSTVLEEEFMLPDDYVRAAAASGNLLVNRCACSAHDILENGDVITHRQVLEEPSIPSERVGILAENEHLLVVEKPSGLPCHPQGRFQRACLTAVLKESHLGQSDAYLHPVNRLDRLTSGVVLLAKTRKAYALLTREEGWEMQKLYLARVHGLFDASAAEGMIGAADPVATMPGKRELYCGEWDTLCQLPLRVQKHLPNQPLTTVVDAAGGKPAATLFRLLRDHCVEGCNSSLVLCRPLTGRTHQIRVHLQALGFPIVGDPLYGCSARFAATAEKEAGVAPSSGEDGNSPVDEKVDQAAAGEEKAMCLHALAYSIVDHADVAALEPLKRILPVPIGQLAIGPRPAAMVYRCLRSPTWLSVAQVRQIDDVCGGSRRRRTDDALVACV